MSERQGQVSAWDGTDTSHIRESGRGRPSVETPRESRTVVTRGYGTRAPCRRWNLPSLGYLETGWTHLRCPVDLIGFCRGLMTSWVVNESSPR